ncbi:FecR family protein [Mucilaginibacter sp. AW1-3]
MNTVNWELLINYINGDCSDHEMQQVLQWSAEQAENRYLLTYLERRQAQLQQPLKQADIDEQWLHLLSRMFPVSQTDNDQTNSSKPYWFMGLAASLMLFSLLGWFYYKSSLNGGQLQFAQTNANTRSKVSLPDGTLVYLAPDSKLTFKNFDGPKREVNLYGEAFFDVKHISDRPFIIHTNQRLSITVLGTSFNVYTRKHVNAEIKVATGLVGIIINNHTHFLKAGEQLTSNADNYKVAIKKVIIKDASALQNGTLVFNNCDAYEIAQKIQRWYNIKVKVSPTAKKARRFSGEMKDTGIADLLNGLSYATGIHYQFEKTNTLLLF